MVDVSGASQTLATIAVDNCASQMLLGYSLEAPVLLQ